MDRLPLLVGLALLLAALVLIGCGAQRRRATLEAAAPGLGLRYVGRLPELADTELRRMPSIAAADRSFFTHGLQDAERLVFDWTWRKGLLKQRQRAAQTVVAFHREGADWPPFVWTARDAPTTSLERGLGAPLDFPDASGFADRHALRTRDPSSLRPRFEAAGPGTLRLPAGVRVEGAGDWLIAWRPDALLSPPEIAALLEEMEPIARALLEGQDRD